MKLLKLSTASIVLSVLGAVIALAGGASAQRSRARIMQPAAANPHIVHIVARHCQKYARPGGGGAGVNIRACAADRSTVFSDQRTHNLRVNAGINWQADIMANTSTPAVNAQCNYIALTNTAITPGATDTTLSGEIVANGLSRAQGTYNHSANATTYTITKTFTDTTAPQAAQAAGLFTAVSTGTMCFEDTFTAVSLQVNDTLAFTWTVNF